MESWESIFLRHTEYIVEILEPRDVIDGLFGKSIVNKDELESATSNYVNRRERARNLLVKIISKGVTAMQQFFLLLKKDYSETLYSAMFNDVQLFWPDAPSPGRMESAHGGPSVFQSTSFQCDDVKFSSQPRPCHDQLPSYKLVGWPDSQSYDNSMSLRGGSANFSVSSSATGVSKKETSYSRRREQLGGGVVDKTDRCSSLHSDGYSQHPSFTTRLTGSPIPTVTGSPIPTVTNVKSSDKLNYHLLGSGHVMEKPFTKVSPNYSPVSPRKPVAAVSPEPQSLPQSDTNTTELKQRITTCNETHSSSSPRADACFALSPRGGPNCHPHPSHDLHRTVTQLPENLSGIKTLASCNREIPSAIPTSMGPYPQSSTAAGVSEVGGSRMEHSKSAIDSCDSPCSPRVLSAGDGRDDPACSSQSRIEAFHKSVLKYVAAVPREPISLKTSAEIQALGLDNSLESSCTNSSGSFGLNLSELSLGEEENPYADYYSDHVNSPPDPALPVPQLAQEPHPAAESDSHTESIDLKLHYNSPSQGDDIDGRQETNDEEQSRSFLGEIIASLSGFYSDFLEG